MAFVPTTQGIKAFIEYQYVNGGSFGNTLWFASSDITNQRLNDLVSDLFLTVASDIMPMVSNDVSLISVTATDMTMVGGIQAQDFGVGAVVGGTASEVEDIATAAVVTLRTARTGRAFRGRNYVRGIPGTQMTNGLISTAWLADLVSAYETMKSVAAADGCTLSVRQSQVDGVTQNPAKLTIVTDMLVRNRIPGHQRLTNRRP
jgi:hypothetical protein